MVGCSELEEPDLALRCKPSVEVAAVRMPLEKCLGILRQLPAVLGSDLFANLSSPIEVNLAILASVDDDVCRW